MFKARQAELEAARLVKEKEEEEAKQAALQAKKEKDIQKKAIKKERQKLRTSCKVRRLRHKCLTEDKRTTSKCVFCCLLSNRTGITLLTMKLTT